jgi:hypothetical protein
MKSTQDILTEIATVTRNIEDNFPELQKYLDETRSTLPENSQQGGTLDKKDLEDYLNELREMIEKYNKEH